ncbi:MAG: TraR/DksA C4-type zinc finger protein [Candidatus Paceibacterota bacterium]
MALTQEQIEKAKARLEELRAELEKDIDYLESPVDYGDDIDSGDEEADEAEEFSANAGQALDVHARHEAVVTALSKIDRGVYGTCEECSGQIEEEVLLVNPEARYCKKDIAKKNS